MIRGLLTYSSVFAGLAVAVYAYLDEVSGAWEMRVLIAAGLGLITTAMVLFLATKIHSLELFLGRRRSRSRHRAGVVDWSGSAELPSLR